MQAGLRAWSAAGVAAILRLPARQPPRVSWCPRARTQSGVGALPGSREWRHEPVLQIRPSVEAPGERRIARPPIPEVPMEIVVERAAGLDVHKASVTACVRVPA